MDAYNFLKGSQEDINRRLLRKIEKIESSGGGGDQEQIQELIGRVEHCEARLSVIRDIVGESDGDAGTVLGQLKTITMDIGRDDWGGTIKGRIKSLEDRM